MNSEFINHITVHPNWKTFLSKAILNDLQRIENEIKSEHFTPEINKVLRFLELPLKSARIIILGQDPYPQEGVATGRAFEVGTLNSWNKPFRNVSLKNLLRCLYKAYFNEIISFNDLKKKLDNEFPVLPPNQIFKSWESQGVLLLNTSFTCKIGASASHEKKWIGFTSELLRFINRQNPELTWFLWGNHAINSTKNVQIKNKFESQHPMMCYPGKGRESDFLFGNTNCFESFIGEIDWTGFNLKKGAKTSGLLF